MNTGNVAPQQKFRSGRQQFKCFCKLNSMNKKTFFELNSFGFRYLYKVWCQQTEKLGKDNQAALMGTFGGSMDLTKKAINDLLSDDSLKNINQLKKK